MTGRAPLPSLTGVVITRDEEDRIARCVESMVGLCRDVLVLDSGSTDATVAVARAAGARVEHQDWLGFSAQKNAAIARAQTPWVLLLDADEWLAPGGVVAIRALFEQGRAEAADVWRLPRQTLFLGRKLRFGGRRSEPIERLFRQDLRHAAVDVHEWLEHRGRRVAALDAPILHDTARSVAHYRAKLDGYARLQAQRKFGEGRRAGRATGYLHAAFYVAKDYVVRGGFLDGAAGWHYHRCQARYVLDKYRYLAQLGRARTVQPPKRRP